MSFAGWSTKPRASVSTVSSSPAASRSCSTTSTRCWRTPQPGRRPPSSRTRRSCADDRLQRLVELKESKPGHAGQPRRRAARASRSIPRRGDLATSGGRNPPAAGRRAPRAHCHDGDAGELSPPRGDGGLPPQPRPWRRGARRAAAGAPRVCRLRHRGGPATLVPEVTVTAEGVFWHPLASPSSEDMLVSRDIFPLAPAVRRIEEQSAAFGESRARKASLRHLRIGRRLPCEAPG